jgi:hypothetical protein
VHTPWHLSVTAGPCVRLYIVVWRGIRLVFWVSGAMRIACRHARQWDAGVSINGTKSCTDCPVYSEMKPHRFQACI